MTEEQLRKYLENALRQAGLDTYYSANQTVAERLSKTASLQEMLNYIDPEGDPR